MNEIKYYKLETQNGENVAVGLDYFEPGVTVGVFVMLVENKTIVTITPTLDKDGRKSLDEILKTTIEEVKGFNPNFSPKANSVSVSKEDYYTIINSYEIREDYDSVLYSKLPDDVLLQL